MGYTSLNELPSTHVPRLADTGKTNCSCCRRYGQALAAPRKLLAFFTFAQTFIYYDRGLIAGMLPAIEKDFNNLDKVLSGLLGSGFILGFTVAAPIFAHLSRRVSPYKLMSLGLYIWAGAVLLCGFAQNFTTLLLARVITGVGEASFAGLAPTCLDDVAPAHQRSLWLGIFFAAIPIGGALGYVAGGLFASYSWHLGFIIEALLVLPVCAVIWFVPPIKRVRQRDLVRLGLELDFESDFANMGGDSLLDEATADGTLSVRPRRVVVAPLHAVRRTPDDARASGNEQPAPHGSIDGHDKVALPAIELVMLDSEDTDQAVSTTGAVAVGGVSFWGDVMSLLANRTYMYISLGYAGLMFVVGGLAFWGPENFSKTLDISLQSSTTAIGVVTLTCGVVGTAFGGWLLDHQGGGRNMKGVALSMKLGSIFASGALVFATAAIISKNLYLSLGCLAVADFLLFGTGAPTSAALLSVVPSKYRSLAMAMSIFLMHALGDLPSPIIIGAMTDRFDNVRASMLFLCGWLCWTVLLWVAAWRRASKLSQYEAMRDEQDDDNVLMDMTPVQSSTDLTAELEL